jgi:hypothetical protein
MIRTGENQITEVQMDWFSDSTFYIKLLTLITSLGRIVIRGDHCVGDWFYIGKSITV